MRRLTAGSDCKIRTAVSASRGGGISDSDYDGDSDLRRAAAPGNTVAPDIGGRIPILPRPSCRSALDLTIRPGEDVDQDKPLEGGCTRRPPLTRRARRRGPGRLLRPDFRDIDVVAYTPLFFGEPISPIRECAAFTIRWPGRRARRSDCGLAWNTAWRCARRSSDRPALAGRTHGRIGHCFVFVARAER